MPTRSSPPLPPPQQQQQHVTTPQGLRESPDTHVGFRPEMPQTLGSDPVIDQKPADTLSYSSAPCEAVSATARFGFPNQPHHRAGRESHSHSSEFFIEEHKGPDSTSPPLPQSLWLSPLHHAATTTTSTSPTDPHNPDRSSSSVQAHPRPPASRTAASGTAILPHHDSTLRFTAATTSDSPRPPQPYPRLGNNNVTAASQPVSLEHRSSNIIINNSRRTPQGPTMGLNNNFTQEGLPPQRTASHTNTQSSSSSLLSSSPKMEGDNLQSTTTSVAAGDYLRTSERKDHEDDSTTAHSMDSSVPSPALSAREPTHHAEEANPLGAFAVDTTPSTVSTAPSTTDEASLMLDLHHLDRLALRMDTTTAVETPGMHRHRRMPSWEAHTLPAAAASTPEAHPVAPHVGALPANNVWNSPQAHARIASFRQDADSARFGFRPPEPQLWQQQQQPQPHLSPHANHPLGVYRQGPSPYGGPTAAYPSGPAGMGRPSQPGLPPTPPRGAGGAGRGQRGTPRSGTSSFPGSSPSGPGAGSRSAAEVLKTLLRKKACLYEPDTSRAVALVTWLVGRELAMEFGFFSRQQLQAGVHACVAEKIDSGVITRTKVNRCMQIILNSCFHYIIPRPDGLQENSEAFRLMFAREVTDDAVLLRELPHPWHDLTVSADSVLVAALSESSSKSPAASPALSSKGDPSKEQQPQDDGDPDGKRAVLLCYNENVRCAEDVFRCHNEFIRDTAHASHLQLSSYEWRIFFGPEAAGAPHLWGNIGIPIPSNELCDPGQVDALGMMSMNELTKFRTFWCTKRYEHDHELCGFAHMEVNGGWLRRNPSHYNYRAEMCQYVTVHKDPASASKVVIINECPHGMNCECAHSFEEMFYHPMRYKRRVCSATQRQPAICSLGDACPDFHAMETYRFPSKKIDGRAGSRHARHTGTAKVATGGPPTGAPVLYTNPAPPSRFEEQLVLPGLRNLYRRHSAVTKAHIRQGRTCVCTYSNFGDEAGVTTPTPTSSGGGAAPSRLSGGLPSPVHPHE